MKKRKKRDFSGSDRRLTPRLKPSSVPFLKSVSFNQGYDVEVIDISRGGMLLKTDVRLRPQTKVMLKIVTGSGVFKTAGCVLRSSVVSLDGGPTYQAAIAFDDPFQIMDSLVDNPVEQAQNMVSKDGINLLEDDAEFDRTAPDSEVDQVLTVLTVIAKEGCDATLRKSFLHNDW